MQTLKNVENMIILNNIPKNEAEKIRDNVIDGIKKEKVYEKDLKT